MSRCVYNRLTVSGDENELAAFSTEVRATIKNALDQECSQEWYDEAGVLDALYDSKTEELGGLIVLDWITDRKTPEFKI